MAATVTISIEIELAWGHHDTVGANHPALSPSRRAETEALERLLAWCEEFSIPITFNVVGHLLHRECSGSHPGPHDPGWFDADPGTDVDTDPHFYAPDLVEMIVDSPVEHEITTHTYSHALADVHSPEIFDWEFDRVFEVHEDLGLSRPRTFVPPRHQQPQTDLLKRNAIRVVRVASENSSKPSNRISLFYNALNRSHPIGDTQRTDGIVRTYCLPYPTLTTEILPTGQQAPHPAYRAIPEYLRRQSQKRTLKRAIDAAGAHDEPIHLWSHLYNFANEPQQECIRTALAHLASQRDAGKVAVAPMDRLQ